MCTSTVTATALIASDLMAALQSNPPFLQQKNLISRAWLFFIVFFLLYCCCVRRHCRMADLSIQIPKSTFQITDEGRNLVFCFLCAKCTQNFKCATLTLTHIDWVRVSLGWRGHLFPLRFTCSLTKKNTRTQIQAHASASSLALSFPYFDPFKIAKENIHSIT